MLAFYDFPALHWQSIRTSNPIESTFGTIRHRTKRSKGCLSRDGMLHMMFSSDSVPKSDGDDYEVLVTWPKSLKAQLSKMELK